MTDAGGFRGTREETMTKGEYRVGLDFNPSNSGVVDNIKRMAAELIDYIEGIPGNENPERGRLKALAQTHVEDGAMWAVKAATKQPQDAKQVPSGAPHPVTDQPEEVQPPEGAPV